MVMPYHLHMPSYFLETFTEYPEVENDHFEHILGNCIDVVSQIRLVYGILFRELPPILSWPVLLLRA